ncbi:MAG: hypothetical protein EOP38_24190 [Rubrivivax sp.]|nr:MAG: hypothetical protein EOP38_24190 [Rubrivivax sp.]
MRMSSRSSNRSFQALRLLALAAVAVVLVACSVVRLAYNQAGNLAYWQLNRAFDLNPTQVTQVKDGLNEFFKWHRQAELPVYGQLLNRAAKEAQGSITPELACERRLEFERVGRRSMDHAVPFLAELVRSLSPAQIRHLQAFFDDSNEDFRDDYLPSDPEDRQEAAAKFVIKWTEFFYGRLSKAQREQLAKGVAEQPMTAQDVDDERVRVQQEFLQIARRVTGDKLTQAQTEQLLRAMIQQGFEPSTEPRRGKLASWISSGCALTAVTHNGTSAEQRNKVSETLTNWEKDLKILASDR